MGLVIGQGVEGGLCRVCRSALEVRQRGLPGPLGVVEGVWSSGWVSCVLPDRSGQLPGSVSLGEAEGEEPA